MAIVRNDSLTRVVMLLCFGTAILSLAVQWRMTSSMTPQTKSARGGNVFSGQASAAEKPWQLTQTKRQNVLASNISNLLSTQGSDQQRSSQSPTYTKTQVVVDLSDRRVYVHREDLVIASYPIGVGKKGWETPTGSFQIMNKQLYPIWRHPITGRVFPSGTDSPLGDRWIGFWSDGRNQIGFHGTPDDEVVGAAISHGCLRMRNPDVRLLYKQVSLGTPVEVRQ
ncbi:L,D-transpeptidase [Mastigocladopsis repens]|uniref:L,D-transpeptidase n=1 Tax=Mastigocladopsis repens TaxID=221287 RepID=UPI0004745969|nr:L,D-transpeptidase [Mastigocladopsis repens]